MLRGAVAVVGAGGAPPAAGSAIERVILYGQVAPRNVIVRGAKGGGAAGTSMGEGSSPLAASRKLSSRGAAYVELLERECAL